MLKLELGKGNLPRLPAPAAPIVHPDEAGPVDGSAGQPVALVAVAPESAADFISPDDCLFYIAANPADITALIADPVAFSVAKLGGRDFRAIDIPDVTILFSFADNPRSDDERYPVEGAFFTNILTVRAARTPTGPPDFLPANVLAARGQFSTPDSAIHVAQGPNTGELYAHYQLDGTLADARAQIAAFVLDPAALITHLNSKTQVTLTAQGEVPVDNPVTFVLPGTVQTANFAAALGLRELRFLYQWLNPDAPGRRELIVANGTCSCNKVRSVKVPDPNNPGRSIAIVDTIVATQYIPCPPPRP